MCIYRGDIITNVEFGIHEQWMGYQLLNTIERSILLSTAWNQGKTKLLE